MRDSILSKARKRLHSAGNALIAGGAAAGFAGVVNALGKNSFTSGSISGDGDGDGDTCAAELQEAIDDVLADPIGKEVTVTPSGDVIPNSFTIFLSGDLTQLGWQTPRGPIFSNPTSISCANSIVSIPWANLLRRDLTSNIYIDAGAQYEDGFEFSDNIATAEYEVLQILSYNSATGIVNAGYATCPTGAGSCTLVTCLAGGTSGITIKELEEGLPACQ